VAVNVIVTVDVCAPLVSVLNSEFVIDLSGVFVRENGSTVWVSHPYTRKPNMANKITANLFIMLLSPRSLSG
jgi:hypothetical protein